MSKKFFVSKVIQMTLGMIVFNISGLLYNIFISSELGAETIGLFHLVGCVYSIGISICVAGMNLTATRLMSDMPRNLGLASSDSIIYKCLTISLIMSVIATVLIHGFADYIAKVFFEKPQAAQYIRKISLCLSSVAISSVIGGYFTAFGYVGAISCARFFGEAALWIFTFFFLKKESDECMAIVSATMTSTFTECIINVILWKFSGRNIIKKKSKITYSDVIKLCAPLTLGSTLRTGLSSAENMLLPKRLSVISPDALTKYGVLKGMAMPVLFFPSVITGAFTSLLVPEIARRFSQKLSNSVRYVSKLSIFGVIKFGFCVSTVFFAWGSDIAEYIFHIKTAGKYLHLLSFLPLLMYVDSVTDTILKGMNEQIFSIKVNTADAIFRIILVIFLVPHFGIEAYIAILYISEIFNLTLSFWRLKKITALQLSFARAVLAAILSIGCAFLIIHLIHPQNLITEILTFISIYFGASEILSSFFKKDS